MNKVELINYWDPNNKFDATKYVESGADRSRSSDDEEQSEQDTEEEDSDTNETAMMETTTYNKEQMVNLPGSREINFTYGGKCRFK